MHACNLGSHTRRPKSGHWAFQKINIKLHFQSVHDTIFNVLEISKETTLALDQQSPEKQRILIWWNPGLLKDNCSLETLPVRNGLSPPFRLVLRA